ncbi:hypothetical protein ROLI_026580 [Roseobacter fucihabitans]|uniref:Uncharacterized protein n=1 Tax=Roseobacter fucihabitans TaxID=1537242 RepID=A0ABZ2BUE0_9RHOB|nr:hypothetical protein [Roseobacter litoralis]MBC6965721.1 hypothetical protein [Roseobacter litoralis]
MFKDRYDNRLTTSDARAADHYHLSLDRLLAGQPHTDAGFVAAKL